jgi:GT2 family glycosyltransferase
MGIREAMTDLSISIINTNNREIALQCLRSVYETADSLELEVFVVNNACTDGSSQAIQQAFPQVKIIENERMLGFSTNNNLALAQASGRYWMLLNDDTIVQPGAFQAMVEFMDQNPQAGGVGAALLNRDSNPQYCYDYAPNPFYEGLRPFSEYLYPRPRSNSEPLEIGFASGACLMVRASVLGRIGMLDIRFDPLYSEEVDWCYRIKKAGWLVYHLPKAKVIHLGDVSTRRSSIERYERIYTKKTIFFRKHFGERGARVYKTTLFFSNLIKTLLWLPLWVLGKPEAKNELRLHWNMVRKAPYL